MGTRKNPTRDAIKSIEKEAQCIREEYAYMDDMPLKGWIWEFVRRGQVYQDRFKAFEDIATRCRTMHPRNAEIDRYEYNELFFQEPDFWKAFEDLIGAGVLWPIIAQSKLDADLFFTYCGTEVDDGDGFPRPSRKFCDFDDNLKPIVYRKPAYYSTGDAMFQHAKADILFLLKKIFFELEEARTEHLSRKSLTDNMDRWIYRTLNLFEYRFGKGIVITVDTLKGKEEIKAELNSIIDEVVPQSKTKRRNDKWKYYLIVYDLKLQGFRYPEISQILLESFSDEKTLFDVKNIENYWKHAHSLIDHSEYKNYL